MLITVFDSRCKRGEVRGVKGQNMVQNDKKLCLSRSNKKKVMFEKPSAVSAIKKRIMWLCNINILLEVCMPHYNIKNFFLKVASNKKN